MGWNIGVKENTLKMSREVADRLIIEADGRGQIIYYDGARGISFDVDSMEHMDFLWEKWALDILDDPSVNGDVVFMSAEGDDAGELWGYRFKNGSMTRLKAVVSMVEIEA